MVYEWVLGEIKNHLNYHVGITIKKIEGVIVICMEANKECKSRAPFGC